jgi:hypothetical protein
MCLFLERMKMRMSQPWFNKQSMPLFILIDGLYPPGAVAHLLDVPVPRGDADQQIQD